MEDQSMNMVIKGRRIKKIKNETENRGKELRKKGEYKIICNITYY